MNHDPEIEFVHLPEICGERVTNDAGSVERSTQVIDKFFERLELQNYLRRTSEPLSKGETADFLGMDEDELRKREAASVRVATKTPLRELEGLVKSHPELKKAAGYLDHLYKKSFTLDEALERAAELVSDDASPEQWKLISKARAALDISAFLTVLTDIFSRQPV
jgi:hypothetical protein